MTFDELQKQVGEYVYTEDNGMARVALASVLANRLKLGDPVWLLLIGPSSGGKSQILRPIALSDERFIKRVDDLTENTLLSGMGDGSKSLLKQIGSQGIVVISDLTVLFSKNQEARAAILSQLRMVYDGEMTKFVGNSEKPIEWKGYLGMLAGSTPSVYGHFEEVADMGERFIYYRMKPYDVEKATRISLERTVFGKDLDRKLADMYTEYVDSAGKKALDSSVPELSRIVEDRILRIALFAARLRTPAHYDKYEKKIDRIPVSEAPMRVALQLRAIARGLSVMQYNDTGRWDLSEEDLRCIEWCAYSLANEERRACLKVLGALPKDTEASTQAIADEIRLPTSVIGMHLQHLAAIGIIKRSGSDNSLSWKIEGVGTYNIVRSVEGIKEDVVPEERSRTSEEGFDDMTDEEWAKMG